MEISKILLEKYKEKYNNSSNRVVANAIAKVGVREACFNNDVIRKHNFVFSDVTKQGEITHQKASGRCWMFSALNVARINTMEKINVETFEFSQNYTLFIDKLEKSNYFLESILETLDEKIDSRIISHLLKDPVQDGGQWDMFKGLLKKYGAVPKYVMPETYHSSNTRYMSEIITTRLRKMARDLRNKYNGSNIDELRKLKEEMLYDIYDILVKCLGSLPEKFDFTYVDKDEKYHIDKDLTPVEFFEKYVGWNLEDKVSLINAPTIDKPYNKVYTVKYLGTVKEESEMRYLNVPIEELKKAAIRSIKDGIPVWFGCDVGKLSSRDYGIMDYDAYSYDEVFSSTKDFNKADRLDYGESLLTHAMVFTGVDLDENGNPKTWKVENSWGKDTCHDGMFSMSDKWFEEYNYQIMVDKKYISEEYLVYLDTDAVELEPWDPFGALAMVK